MSRRGSSLNAATEDEIQDLVQKLRAILNARANLSDTTKLVEEASNHIKRLHRKVDHLSERISQLMDLGGTSNDGANTLQQLLG